MPIKTALALTTSEREELETRQRSRAGRSDEARRARLLLMLADGHSYRAICAALGCSSQYVARWKQRFAEERLAGLYGRHLGRRPSKRTAQLEAR